MRVNPVALSQQPTLKRLLPERRVPFAREVLPIEMPVPREVVDQDIQATVLFPLDALKQGFDLVGLGVIDLYPNACAATSGYPLRRLLDRLRPADGRGMAANAAPGAVDRGPGLAQHAGNAPARAARRAGDDRHLPCQWFCHTDPPA